MAIQRSGLLLLFGITLWVMGCAPGGSATSAPTQEARPETVRLILGAYTTPREAYAEIIPLFQTDWKTRTGQAVEFQESYLGSGAQSRAIVEGFEADIAALSLEADITRIQDAGLIRHDWKSKAHQGMVSDSIAVLLVRKGNPKSIRDWHDLTQPGLSILTPSPKTSGGAMWNILALYGATRRGHVQGVAKDDSDAARQFLMAVLRNVTVMDKGARESITTFEKGVGDVAITYENEALVGRQSGQDYEYVIPRSTIRIENPVAVIDAYVDKHGTREVAEAFRDFLLSREAQRVFARHGLRVRDEQVARETAGQYPAVPDLFDITYFGGWAKATPDVFGDDGLFTQAINEAQGQ